jgi:phosphoglycolate phosphatase
MTRTLGTRSLLVTDLDNTLWDWFEAWHASFSAMLQRLVALSGVPAEILEPEIRTIHQARGTAEYSYLLNEIPALRQSSPDVEPMIAYDEAMHALHSERKRATTLYPKVRESLQALSTRGVTIVAYTESLAYWTEWRIKHTGLDGVIDALYSAPDHDLPSGVTLDDVRQRPADEYGLKHTKHLHVARGVVKPNEKILRSIIADYGRSPKETVYVGDSLMKDIAMAQAAQVLDVHAKYGEVQDKAEYALLQRVSHWPQMDVVQEQEVRRSAAVVPTVSLEHGFFEVLPIFGL